MKIKLNNHKKMTLNYSELLDATLKNRMDEVGKIVNLIHRGRRESVKM